ncbi:pickpocket protein 28 [Anabrus simplex]|uniref:pickpocket protein 28 n=1 Tax=Anabrus simplex TaxID=316456 RepID=UPI0035A3A188
MTSDIKDQTYTAKRRNCGRLLEYSKEFCEKTSLHGLQYLGETHRSWPERVCWVLAISLSIAFCMNVIGKQWNKWKTSPVIVTFAETSTPAWDIPFPAVTICSETKFRQSTVNMTDLLTKRKQGRITANESKILEYTYMLCNVESSGGPSTTDIGLIEHILKITPPVTEVIKGCRWRGKQTVRCRDIFKTIVADEGVCYTFNSLAVEELFTEAALRKKITNATRWSKNWSFEKGFTTEEDLDDTYPLRTKSAGAMSGLFAYLYALDDERDLSCRIPLKGFKMVIHSPAVFPEIKKEYFRVPSNYDVVIGVSPKVIITADELRSYSPEARKCYFGEERKLLFFRVYTQESCELECFTNFTQIKCDCAEYYMPLSGLENTQLCGPEKLLCTKDIQDDYNFDTVHREQCHCLPSCTEIQYDVETSQAEYMTRKPYGNETELLSTSISVFLKNMQVLTRKRSELYGLSDFLANCGGLLGLCIGFSILSLVEVVYFFTLRIFFNFRKEHKKQEAPHINNEKY